MNPPGMRTRLQRGFTLIELMVVIAIIGLLSAVAVPTFVRYTKKARTTEARMQLEKIYNGARVYYYETHGHASLAPLASQFPAPEPRTPALSCCVLDGGPRCAPEATQWETPTWNALKFSLGDPHYYQYSFESEGTGLDAQFTAIANGDLDCDSVESTFIMWGYIETSSGEPVLSGAASRQNELE